MSTRKFVATILPPSSAEEVHAYLQANPEKATRIANTDPSTRSRVRKRLSDSGYSAEAISAFIPKKCDRTVGMLSDKALNAIENFLGNPVSKTVWTPITAGHASEAIVGAYSNPSTVARTLTFFRNMLRETGCSEDILEATRRPAITREHNAQAGVARQKRMEVGLDIPKPLQDVVGILNRVDAYVANTKAYPTGQVAADFLIVFSARPGEAETLKLGENGGVVGVLKKRGDTVEYPIVSVIPKDRAQAFLTKWVKASTLQRRLAMRDLSDIVHKWGIQRKDLRAIGAHLAVKAHAPANVAQGEVLRIAALRHENPTVRAVDHYAIVNEVVVPTTPEVVDTLEDYMDELLGETETPEVDDTIEDYMDELLGETESPEVLVESVPIGTDVDPPNTPTICNTTVNEPSTIDGVYDTHVHVQAGPFTGKGAQQKAKDIFPLVLFVDRYKFYSFANPDARAIFLEDNQDKECIERIDCTQPYHVVVDVDGPEAFGMGGISKVVEAWTTAAIELGVPTPNPRVVWGIRSGKTSAHLIADGWQVPNGRAAVAFASMVRAHTYEPIRCYVDIQASGSTTTSGMRLPGFPKKGIPDSVLAHDGPISSWCLQPGTGPIYTPALPSPINGENGPVEAEGFAEYIAEKFPQYIREPLPNQGTILSYIRICPGYCQSCERDHTSAGAYVRASGGTLWLNCRRSTSKALASRRYTPEKMPEPDSYEMVSNPDVTANTQFNSVAFEEHTRDIFRGCDTYIRAPWKTGKTMYVGMVIKGLKSNARVLVISCRKTLSTALVASFGATDYRNIKGTFDDVAIQKHPISVWQVESLKRIPSDVPPFDLVVIDEPAAMISHVYQPNASHAARVGITKARGFIERAVRIYVSDNDLSTEVVDAFKHIRTNKECKVLVNKYKSWEDTSAELIYGNKAPTTVRKRLFQFLEEQKTSRDAGQPWTAAVVPCHSKKLAIGIANEARGLYGDDLVKLYTSEVGDHDKMEDFKTPTKAWDGMVLVVYTATVSVGVSANLDHISQAFGFFTSNNAGSQQSAQMLFRCRKLRHVTISYDGLGKYGIPQSLNALFTWATLSMNRHIIPDEFRGDCNPMVDGPTQEDPDLLSKTILDSFEGRMWACDQIERNRSARWFVPRLVRILESAGCKVTVINADETPQDAEMSAVEARAKHFEAVGEYERNKLASEATSDAVDDILENNDDDSERMYTAKEHQGRRVMHAMKTYARGGGFKFKDVVDLEFEPRVAWITTHVKPKNIQAYQRLSNMKFGWTRPHEAASITSASESNNMVRRTFNVLGIRDCLQTGIGGVVRRDLLEHPTPDLMAVVNDINTHGLRVFDDTKANRRRKAIQKEVTVKNVVGTVNVALSHVGATLASCANIKGRSGDTYTIHWAWRGERVGGEWIPTPTPQPQHPHHDILEPFPNPQTALPTEVGFVGLIDELTCNKPQ